MDLVILNAGNRLEELTRHHREIHNRIRIADDSADDLCSLAAEQKRPFVLLWHKWASKALPILSDLVPKWPENLVACALFSSGQYANSDPVTSKALIKEVLPEVKRRVHICSSAIDPSGPADAVLARLKLFASEVLDVDGSNPEDVPFILVEPAPADGRVFTAQLAALITERKLCPDETINNCVNWDEIRKAPAFADIDLSSVRTATQKMPDQMRCANCAYRSALRHTLTGDPEPLEVINGKKGTLSLEELLKQDVLGAVFIEAENLLILNSRCSFTKLLPAVQNIISFLFENHCSLVARRPELQSILLSVRNNPSPSTVVALANRLWHALDCSALVSDDRIIRLRGAANVATHTNNR